MPDTWITKMSHYDYSDEVEHTLPREATRLATYLGSILYETLHRIPAMPTSTGIQCRRRPGHVRCSGYILSELSEDKQQIRWWCEECGDNGYISDWEGTRWDPRKHYWASGRLFEAKPAAERNPEPQTGSQAPDFHEVVNGTIECDRTNDGLYPRIVTPAKEYTWEELGRELMTFEGFRVLITAHNRSE